MDFKDFIAEQGTSLRMNFRLAGGRASQSPFKPESNQKKPLKLTPSVLRTQLKIKPVLKKSFST